MVWKCYDKPKRSKPRNYTEKDAGRIVCRVVGQGGDRDKLRAEIEKCLDLCDHERIRQAILQALEKASALTVAISTILAILSGITLVTIVLSRLPIVRVLLGTIAKQLETQKLTLEKGLLIEGELVKILETLPKPK